MVIIYIYIALYIKVYLIALSMRSTNIRYIQSNKRNKVNKQNQLINKSLNETNIQKVKTNKYKIIY